MLFDKKSFSRTGALHDALAPYQWSLVTLQCELVSGWGLRKQRSAPPYMGHMSHEGLYFTLRKLSSVWKQNQRLFGDFVTRSA